MDLLSALQVWARHNVFVSILLSGTVECQHREWCTLSTAPTLLPHLLCSLQWLDSLDPAQVAAMTAMESPAATDAATCAAAGGGATSGSGEGSGGAAGGRAAGPPGKQGDAGKA